MRKMFKRLLIALLALLLILATCLMLLIGTATGNRWILDQVANLIPGTLTVADWQGSVLTEFSARDIDYRYGDLHIRLDQLDADPTPAPLTRGWLEFSRLSLGTLAITLPASETMDEPQAVTLPDSLTLPFGVRIDALTLTALHLNDEPVIQNLSGQSLVAWRRFQIARLQTRTLADAHLSASAQGRLTYPFDLQAALDWQLPLPANDTLSARQASGQLKLDGPLTALTVSHELAAPLQVNSQGQWQLKDQQWYLDLTHHWSSQPLPLSQEPALLLGQGELVTRGALAQLAIRGHSALTRGDLGVQIALDSHLVENGIAVNNLQIVDDKQQLTGQGQLLFNPLSWKMTLGGSLDTAILSPALPGKLDIDGHSRGRFRNGQWTLAPSRLTLTGRVRQHPLTLDSTVESDGEQLQLATQGAWGDNRLSARGTLLPDWHLDASLALSQLAQLHPDAHGALQGDLSLHGPLEAPRLSGHLNGSALGWQQWQLAQAESRFRDLGTGNQPMNLSLQTGELTLDDTRQADQLSVTLEGTRQQHRLALSAERQELTLASQLEGGLDAKLTWQGTLQSTRLRHQQLGQWEQAQPSQLTLSAGQQSLSSFCLQQQNSSLCLKGNHGPQQLQADTALSAFPLALVNTLLGPDFSLAGTLDAKASLTGSLDQPQGELTASTTGARITLNVEDAPPPLDLDTLTLNSHLEQDTVHSRFTLKTDLGHADATVSHGLDPDAALAGQVRFQLHSLGMLQLITADLREIRGSLAGDMALAGTLRQPQLQGDVRLEQGHALIPVLGTAIDDASLTLTGSPQGRLDITGSAKLGDGTLTLGGFIDPSRWPLALELTAKGNHLLAADRPDARVWVSPDLTLAGDLEGLDLTGQLTIPEAQIHPEQIPEGAVTVSEDQVLVHHEGDTGERLPLGMAVTLTLGDQVHFRGFGLDATLGGTLRIEQQPQRPPQLNGELVVKEGRYRAYGQNLAISGGQLIFQGPPDNPGLDIRAIRKIPSEAITVGVQLGGTLQEPEASLFSDPSMEQSQVMSYLLTGRPLEGSNKSDANRIAQALALYGLEKGSGVTEKIGDKLGVDEITVGSDWETDDASLMLGKQLSDRLYLTYAIGLFDAVSTVMLRYTLTRQLHLEARSSSEANSIDLIWEKELR